MGGSTADTPTTPESLRVSDADRDHAVNELRNEFVEGRLSHETFVYRMQTALDARNHGQLANLFTDLPPRRVRLLARIRTTLRRVRFPAANPGHPGGAPDQVVRYGGSRPFTGSGSSYEPGQSHGFGLSYGPGQSHGFGSFPWPGPGAAPGQFNRAAGPAATPVPLFFPPGRGDRFTIGRTRDCDLCLADLSVSRRHAELMRGADGWLLNDLGSHNGTRLNGWLVRETVPVRAGDRLEFGSAIFVLQDDPNGLTPAE